MSFIASLRAPAPVTLAVAAVTATLATVGFGGCSSEETSATTTTGTAEGGSGTGTGGSSTGTGSGTGGGSGGGEPVDRGAIVVDADDPAWLAHEDGTSYFLCGPGNPEGFLYRGTRNTDGTRDGDQQDLIDKLAPTGANVISVIAVRSHGGDGGDAQNPFVDSDPTNGVDPVILAQWDEWFTAMDQGGITTFFIFYDDGALVWDTGDSVSGPEQTFLETMVDTFEHLDRLIWVIAEDDPLTLSTARAANIASIIRTADDGNHVIAADRWNPSPFDLAADPHVDQLSFESQTTTVAALHDQVVSLFEEADGAYNLHMYAAADMPGDTPVRAQIWATALGGAYVSMFGQDIETTAVAELEDCGRLREFMEAMDLTGMAPHDELAFGGTEYLLAVPGERYAGYANSPTADLGVAALPSGTWQLSWFDAAAGAWEHETLSTTGGGDASFEKPASMGDEVAFYLR